MNLFRNNYAPVKSQKNGSDEDSLIVYFFLNYLLILMHNFLR